MKLDEAWLKIMEMERSEQFSSNQIHSILSDLGVFKTNPRIRLVLKAALSHNLWQIICNARISNHDIISLKAKLDYDGFSESAIQTVIESFWTAPDCPNIKKEVLSTVINNGPIQSNNCQKCAPTKITSTSSCQDISTYLNSVFTIDSNSFKRYGLELQKLDPIKWEKGTGYYYDEYGACFSFEVVGNTKFRGDIEVEIYDLNGFLRNICFRAGVYIDGKYSIINEKKIVDLSLPPENISKIVLHIGVDGVHLGKAFYRKTHSIVKYNGKIENETETFEILDTQFLFAIDKPEENISVFIRYKLNQVKKKCRWVGEKNLYIVLFDKKGLVRQRFPFVDSMEYYKLCNNEDKREHCAFSYQTISSWNPSLKMPFEEIGKIVFVEE